MQMKQLATVMIVHGPEAFDRGDVGHLTSLIGPDRVVVAGIMGRTAAEEAGIPFIHHPHPPSTFFSRPDAGTRAFLVNRGKTPESGRIFGEIVAGRIPPSGGMIQVECSSGIIYRWNGGDEELARSLSETIGYPVEDVESLARPAGDRRIIRGCRPGEAVFVNGVVIGTATAGEVELESANGDLRAVHGIAVKAHGIEKLRRLGPVDVASAWCKSGPVRQSEPAMRPRRTRHGRIRVVDHAGCDLYRGGHEGVCGILSIGDDTTAVCGHICAHLGIPVFGITDGDGDGIVQAAYPPGSVVVEVLVGRDDDVGLMLAEGIDATPRSWDTWVEEQLARLGNSVRVVVDTTGCR